MFWDLQIAAQILLLLWNKVCFAMWYLSIFMPLKVQQYYSGLS